MTLTYETLLSELRKFSDETYRAFHKKLLKNDRIQVLGVKMPILRKLAKEFVGEIGTLIDFPDEYYEVTFIKCAAAGLLPYEAFLQILPRLVPLLDNWATCDGFTAKCIQENREDFLPHLEEFFASGQEFSRRFSLVIMLRYYVEEKYLPILFGYLNRCHGEKYYVTMAAGWLLAEVLAKYFESGFCFLQEAKADPKIKRKAISKALESFRLGEKEKNALRELRAKIG